ncbi:hypothetical protein POG22_20960 [Geitlerinema sp. CS-897]|uniref:hypothetical protein n=1 Tax=Baaleninema simplex TaxID=2862350 RepID=UPI000364C4FA|nr:hypothetical protein [Baaleninema simplex]MDC0835445.1 hypothetical protein [Geitlerinema sp. CS-897]
MESGSQSGRSQQPLPRGFSQLVGTAIALLTLTLPLLVILLYSAGTVDSPRQIYPMSRLGSRSGGLLDPRFDRAP